MLFRDRQLVAAAYRLWLIHESKEIEPKEYQIEDCPESFLVFLQSKGWLKEDEILKFSNQFHIYGSTASGMKTKEPKKGR